MHGRGGFGPVLALLAVLVAVGGLLPRGLLAEQRVWFTALVWGGIGLAVLVLIALALRGWRKR